MAGKVCDSTRMAGKFVIVPAWREKFDEIPAWRGKVGIVHMLTNPAWRESLA